MADYNPKRSRNLFSPFLQKEYRLSRSKIEFFIECPRCFYLDRRLGIGRPPMPPFNLNIAVDALLKKEFDLYRELGVAHPIMKKAGLNATCFAHEDLNKWRENFIGIQVHHAATNFLVTGAVDDIWQNSSGELIIVDYKATSKEGNINLSSPFYKTYFRQMEIYQWLFRQNGFPVSDEGFFLFCNGDKSRSSFEGSLHFHMELLSYTGKADWIDNTLIEAYATLANNKIPAGSSNCPYCAYRNAAKEVEPMTPT